MLLGFFDEVRRRSPDRTAIEIPPGPARAARTQVSYAALADRADAIARIVAARMRPDAIAVLLLPRTNPDAFAAQLGVLRAGGAFLALDPSFPDARITAIVSDASPVVILTDRAGASRLTGLGLSPLIVSLDDDVGEGDVGGAVAPFRPAAASDLAYVIYTSGTSGRPKGVLVEHGAIANLVQSDLREFGLGADDRVAQGSSHAYDSSIEEMWLAWAAGATVVVMDDDQMRAGPDLPDWLRDERITALCPPPTLLRMMPRRAAGELPALRLIYAGGEALTRDLVDIWAPGRRFVNGYGPTECAVTAVRGDVHAGRPVSIGRPVSGVCARVLDDNLEEIADGTRGELCLEGAGLARGYQGLPDETAARFPVHPRFGRLYRTGDLAHRDAEGIFWCHGRIDTQVKLRGYRIELEEVDSHLQRVPGVQTAACRVSGDGARQRLIAFLVSDQTVAKPSADALRDRLGAELPAYMVPAVFRWIDALPVSTGGKLNRAALPADEEPAVAGEKGVEARPESDREIRIERALRAVLRRDGHVSIDAHFFDGLGGDSLLAAEFTTRLREDPQTARVTVRDVYEWPTVRQLAAKLSRAAGTKDERATVTGHDPATPAELRERPSTIELLLVTLAQGLWLLVMLLLMCGAGALIVAAGLPVIRGLTIVQLVVLTPLLSAAGLAAYAVVSLAFAVIAKTVLIGAYRPARVPMWTWAYLRHWIVGHAAGTVPWWLLAGTELQMIALRALGARIGRRVHLHHGVDVRQGGWDLLEIGDEVSVGADGELRLVDLEAQQLVIGPIAIGAGATIETRAGLAGGTRVGAGARLTALSDLGPGGVIPAGECWSGVPARSVGPAPPRPDVKAGRAPWSPVRWTTTLMAGALVTELLILLPAAIVIVIVASSSGATTADVIDWLIDPEWNARSIVTITALGLVAPLVSVWWSAVVMRIIGAVPEGVFPRESAEFARVWIKTGLLERAGNWVSGTVLWPVWLRIAGAEIGPGCEVSTIIDVVPEHLVMGRMTFLADGVYLGGPEVDRGTVRCARTELGANVFVGNHAVIPAGVRVNESVLIGVSTVASASMRPGTAWFGHPPFSLTRRPPTKWGVGATHQPSMVRYINRLGWEWLRFALPIVPLMVAAIWGAALGAMSDDWRTPAFVLGVLPAVTAAAGAGLALMVLAMKWLLLGRVRPGEHPLWSCWCSRWDFLYVAWGQLARPVLSGFEGTLWLHWYLRAMGARIGRRVALGDGFAQMVDPDMLEIEDDATVQAQFQAHTFEDRVLKIDRVRIRRGATVSAGVVLLYGADLGPGASVAAHSVVMKGEHLRAGRAYAGCPTQEM